jgi:enamine deaminase RidA (YjgF/YER057c/UK114 family)
MNEKIGAVRYKIVRFAIELAPHGRFLAMSAEKRLVELGLILPETAAAGGNYVPAKTVGNLVYLSGVISSGPEGIVTGTVGAGRTVEEAYAAARLCGLSQLAAIRKHLRSLDEVGEVVSVNGYVNAVAGFADSPQVINGASDLFVEVFGDLGRHVRAAVGVNALPRNALVELQMVVRIG